MSSALLLAAPSVPMAIFMPRSSIFVTGAMPLASLRFEAGFVIAHSPFSAKSFRSSSLIHVQW